MSAFTSPRYLQLFCSGELARRVEAAYGMLERCTVCPRQCRAARLAGEAGACRAGLSVRVASAGPHFGEEPPLSGSRGSGTVFFSYCNLRCAFCQNYQISQDGLGTERSADELADRFVDLQEQGCHNINLVSPTPWVPQILRALLRACERGLRAPLVYNSGGYDSLETLKLLDGVVDVYLPDMKYGDDAIAERLSGVQHYVEHNRAALREMFRQVGLLKLDRWDVAQRGLIVRHLVLPNDLAHSREVFRFLADEVSDYVTVSLMAQYRPLHRAASMPELSRPITRHEYEQALDWFHASGLTGGYVQDMASCGDGLPDFAAEEPFDWSGRNSHERGPEADP